MGWGGSGNGDDGGSGGSKPKPIKDQIIDLLIHPCGGMSKLETIKERFKKFDLYVN